MITDNFKLGLFSNHPGSPYSYVEPTQELVQCPICPEWVNPDELVEYDGEEMCKECRDYLKDLESPIEKMGEILFTPAKNEIKRMQKQLDEIEKLFKK